MPKFPPITIIILTYNRPVEVRRTIDALYDYLSYEGELHWLIADNTSPGSYARDLKHDYKGDKHFDVIQNPKGDRNWASNANYALSQNTNDLTIMLEDDFVLKTPIDLSPLAALLITNPSLGLIRLGGVQGHTGLNVTMMEHDISLYLPQYRQGMGMLGRINYWQIDPHSSQLFCYSNHPQLKHRRFHVAHGLYVEGLGLGATEECFAHQVKDNLLFSSSPQIAVPLELAVTYFDHIGVTWRDDMEIAK